MGAVDVDFRNIMASLVKKLALTGLFQYNKIMKWILWSKTNIILAFLLSFSVSPVRGYTQSSDEKPIIRFADVGWDSVRFHNAVAGLVAEWFFNFDVRELSSTSVIAHEALVRGDLDVVMEEWTANLPTYQEDVQGGKLKELGVNFEDNKQGFYVPRYVIEGDAEVLLMDEPFSALDPLVRADMQLELLQLREKLNKTIIFITHDMDEAFKLGDRVAIMRDGRIIQVATPEEMSRNPQDDYVRKFIASARGVVFSN